jgi:hypothetical protein
VRKGDLPGVPRRLGEEEAPLDGLVDRLKRIGDLAHRDRERQRGPHTEDRAGVDQTPCVVGAGPVPVAHQQPERARRRERRLPPDLPPARRTLVEDGAGVQRVAVRSFAQSPSRRHGKRRDPELRRQLTKVLLVEPGEPHDVSVVPGHDPTPGSSATASSRTASTASTGSATILRNAKTRARIDGWSAQCRSSTTSTTDPADSISPSSSSRRVPARIGSTGDGAAVTARSPSRAGPAERASWSRTP